MTQNQQAVSFTRNFTSVQISSYDPKLTANHHPKLPIHHPNLTGYRNVPKNYQCPGHGFGSSIIKTIRVPEGTDESYNQTLYVRPYSNSEDLSLKLDAKVVTPNNAMLVYSLTSPHSNTVIFYKDATGNYCPKN